MCRPCPYPLISSAGATGLSECICPSCGDGRLHWQADEQCDDNNTATLDGCDPVCVVEQLQMCQVRAPLCTSRRCTRASIHQCIHKRMHPLFDAIVEPLALQRCMQNDQFVHDYADTPEIGSFERARGGLYPSELHHQGRVPKNGVILELLRRGSLLQEAGGNEPSQKQNSFIFMI